MIRRVQVQSEGSLPEVPATGSYNVVGVQSVQGAEPLVLVGIINRLRAGERVTLNLSANDPWTRATAAN
jgi:hypothetical protein